MAQEKDPTLTEGTILGLFFIQRYRFLTVDQFARAAGLKRSTAAWHLRLLERCGLLSHFGNTGVVGYGKTPKVYFLVNRRRISGQHRRPIPYHASGCGTRCPGRDPRAPRSARHDRRRSARGRDLWAPLGNTWAGAGSGAVLEPPALVSGLQDVAVMSEPVEQGGGHLGIAAEHRRPFGETEIGGDEHRSAGV
jgi:hypothetical protein